MKYTPLSTKKQLHSELQIILDNFRKKRNFQVQDYIQHKCIELNNYFRESKIDTAVVAISGGVDSSVVLALALKAKELNNSPIKNIIPVALPVHKTSGVVNQKAAENKAMLLCESLGVKGFVINLEEPFFKLKEIVNTTLDIKGDDWADGQLGPCLRTPTLYYINSLMVQKGFKSVILGTINKSEGSYLGYVGKASDGMVDIQLISDIYKSEVYQIANALYIPKQIIQAPPTGDMFDRRTDEDLFGASYDFVELFLEEKENKIPLVIKNKQALEEYKEQKNSLEELHSYNKHKYFVGSQAYHLDLFKNKIFPYWGQSSLHFFPIDYNRLINFQAFPLSLKNQKNDIKVETIGKVIKIKNALNKKEINEIKTRINSFNWQKVGESGYRDDKTVNGSMRISTINYKFSSQLEDRIAEYFPKYNNGFRFEGISDLFRFIKYPKNGFLLPHQDISFQNSNQTKTIYSMVIYLTKGKTSFFKDNQQIDWLSFGEKSDIEYEINCDEGDVLIFPHEITHGSFPGEEEKIVIRTDLIFRKIGV